jgi:hypothetical protein
MTTTQVTDQLAILDREDAANSFDDKCRLLQSCIAIGTEPRWNEFPYEESLYVNWLSNQD